MPFNGSGVFSRLMNWVQDKSNNIFVTASRMDTDSNDFATAFNLCMTRDGQTTATGNFNMGGFLIGNYGSATLAAQLANIGQIQQGGFLDGGTAGGTATALTCTLAPAISAYGNGLRISVTAPSAATGPSTISINGVGVANITRNDTSAIQANDWVAGQKILLEYDGTRFQLINRFVPSTKPSGLLLNVQVITATGIYTPTSGTNSAIVILQGAASGAGGTSGSGGAGYFTASAPGNGGATAIFRLTSIASASITIGAGGAGGGTGSTSPGAAGGSSVFAGVTANGGNGTANHINASDTTIATASAATVTGTPSSGSFIYTQTGGIGGGVSAAVVSSRVYIVGGDGGGSYFSSGGASVPFVGTQSFASPGLAGAGYGAAPSGCISANGGAAMPGLTGNNGVAIIWEFS